MYPAGLIPNYRKTNAFEPSRRDMLEQSVGLFWGPGQTGAVCLFVPGPVGLAVASGVILTDDLLIGAGD